VKRVCFLLLTFANCTQAVGLVKTCKCDTKKTLDTALQEANANSKNADTLAWTKAASLNCALDGKDAKSCVVPPLPTCKAPTYASGVDEACAEVLLKDTCGGFRVSTSCGGSRAAFELIDSSGWFDKNKIYQCPEGWYWTTTAAFYSLTSSNGCAQNNGAASQDTGGSGVGYGYCNRCGWTGYPTNGPLSLQVFAFSDSVVTGIYQHAGSYVGYQHADFLGQIQSNIFAGIICMKK
jgi:hypothetical protein